MKNSIENIIEKQISIKNVNLCGSGTQGFLEILKHMKLNENDEILVPDFICEIIAIPLLVLHIKFKLVDISQGNILPNLNSYKEKFNSHTKAILLAYLWGYIHYDLEEIIKWARNNNLIIIEDIASAYGITYKDKPLGSFGDYCFGSFGKGKMINFGSLGFYSLKIPQNKYTIPFFSTEIIPYTSVIKTIRQIRSKRIRKLLFNFLARIYPLYLGYNFNADQLSSLKASLLNLNEYLNARNKNTNFIFNELTGIKSVNILRVNNEQSVATRICCLSNDSKLYNQLRSQRCWVGDDYNYPISSMLNLYTENNTKKIMGKVFNILSDYENHTLKNTINIIINREIQKCD